jgi:glyoxylase-like metal-dependent hydrolase (beta-lactamase superfamily II)
MYFRQILHEEKSCASYLVGCPTLGVCAVVDPQGDPNAYVERVESKGMALKLVLETHVHADHVSSARELAECAGASLYLGPGAPVRYPHLPLVDGQVLEVGNRRVRVIHTPGHTSEHICLVVDEWFVLTGDVLFVGDVGRVDLAMTEIPAEVVHARAQELYRSLQQLLSLPEWVEVYPAHYAGSVCGRGIDGKTISTIGRERRHNAALGLTADAFARYQTENLPAVPADFHAIKCRNLGPDQEALVS